MKEWLLPAPSRAVLAASTAIFAMSLARRAAAQGCCGGTPQGSLSAMTRLPRESGAVTASLDWEVRKLDTPARTSGPAIAPLIDEQVTMHLLTLGAEVALTDRLSVAGLLPFAINRDALTLPDGKKLSGTAANFGDAAVVAKLRVLGSLTELGLVPTVTLVAAVRMPTGAYRLENAEIGIFSPALQPGTGAWTAMGGASAVQPLTSGLRSPQWSLYGSVIGRYSAANPLGYRLGRSVSYELGAGAFLWRKLMLQAGAAGYAVGADDQHGSTLANTGSHLLATSSIATWRFVEEASVYMGARFPFWRSLNGTQLIGAYAVMAGAEVHF